MAYNNRNRLLKIEHIIDVYNRVKNEDVPDTKIVRSIFPQHKIYISYRLWMQIKNMKPSERAPRQMELFPV